MKRFNQVSIGKLMTDESTELLSVFIDESLEIIDKNRNLLKKFATANNKIPLIREMNRHIHTLKGNSSSFGYKNAERISHDLESRMQGIENNADSLDEDFIRYIENEMDKIENLIENRDSIDSFNEEVMEKTENETIRVPIKTINESLNNIWEIFLIKNQISYLFSNVQNHKALANIQQNWENLNTSLGRNISELEGKVMRMRMTSLNRVFSRMEKIVRSYTNNHPEKAIQFKKYGEETKVDKKVSEMLIEPLVHLIRNAMDHGLEDKTTRQSSGKSQAGTIHLKAQATTDTIEIIVADDGHGIDVNKLIQKALAKGLISSGDIPENEAINLIFKPGFSTAEKVTHISGRGVGMDSIKKSIMEMGGDLSLSTKIGKGTEFKITLPLSLSVISALLLKVNGQIFGSNTHNIVEIIKAEPEDLKYHGNKTYLNFRDSFIECLDVSRVISDYHLEKAKDTEETAIVVVKSPAGHIALKVDEILDNNDLIVKPTPSLVPQINFVDGMSILPTGEPIFIISLTRIIEEIFPIKGIYVS